MKEIQILPPINTRITPENIKAEDLQSTDVFVFGSNELGHHGSGAARFAYDELDAIWFKGFGLGENGNTFAIPTKDWNINTLPILLIKPYVDSFIRFAEIRQDHRFFVTKVGCGIAKYTPEDIAPLFKEAIGLPNVYLPIEFWNVLNKEK